MAARRVENQKPLEMWGGFECTINRVGDKWLDQFAFGPQAAELSAIDDAAALGLKAVRYPLLWERIAPGNLSDIDWSWPDARMQRFRDHDLRPIVGLVHHGSGPRHTSLLDTLFPEKLALYGRAIAERYPDLQFVTPVNEPLTTARFSTLYGHWYPHHRSPESFATAILTQCVATRDTMRAMREIILDLQLVQTEDLGRISSTDELAYQAAFENERRWLTFDLLSGRVTPRHPLWRYLTVNAEARSMLESLALDPCPPDVLGINYYVTSDRHLDHRTDLYDGIPVGGNARHSYVDIEAVRAPGGGITGHHGIICDAWNRYQLPIALTEVHLACSREQQVQWLLSAWRGAELAREDGCDVRAVTAWALMGSRGWDKLLTEAPVSYESGAFTLESGTARRTAVGAVIADLASIGSTPNAAAHSRPWWILKVDAKTRGDYRLHDERTARKTLILGGSGTLGNAFERACDARGIPYTSPTRSQVDISSSQDVCEAIERLRPAMVINAAGYVRVRDAEYDSNACYAANVNGAAALARECARRRIPFLTFSSDLVFDGRKESPYVESDPARPLNVYGASKRLAEREVLDSWPEALVVRSSAFFGPWDEYNFATVALRVMMEDGTVALPYSGMVSPSYVPDVANAALDLLLDGERGIWHLANCGAVSWSDFAILLARRAGLNEALLKLEAAPRSHIAYPSFSVLGTERGAPMPSLDNALDRYFAEISPRISALAPL